MSDYEAAKAAVVDALLRYLEAAESEGKSAWQIQAEIAGALGTAIAEKQAAAAA